MMEESNATKPVKPERTAVILCALLSPVFGSFILAWSWLIETLRIDNYGYGPVFYFVLLSAVLAFNWLIVKTFYKTGSSSEKIRVVIKGTAIAFCLVLGLFVLRAAIYFLAFSRGHWNFG